MDAWARAVALILVVALCLYGAGALALFGYLLTS